MFPRSRSLDLAEMPALRRMLVRNIQLTTLDLASPRTAFRGSVSILAVLLVCGGLLLHFVNP